MLRIAKQSIARVAFNHIRDSYDTMLPRGMRATVTHHTKPDPECVIQRGAFGLRYREMVAAKEPNPPFPPNHYCVHGTSFYDPCDFYPSTFHINMWKQDTVVASSRYVDGNDEKLEMESFGWYDLRGSHPELGDNFVEPSRVVACKSVRGSAVVPLMYLRANIEFVERDFERTIGLVNARAIRLIQYYKKWLRFEWLTENPFATDEFIPGNRCVVISQQLTKSGDATDHIFHIILPT
jgi:predicted GNAT family N-acyltransferase